MILDNCFSPGEVSIETGETVNWSMQGRLDHTVTFADLSSGDVDETFSARFNQPGTYAYQCVYHPGMLGTIEVTGDPADGDPIEPLSELRGLDGFPPAPPEPSQVSLAAGDVGELQQIELTLSSQAWVAIALAALGITLFSSVVASVATRLIRR